MTNPLAHTARPGGADPAADPVPKEVATSQDLDKNGPGMTAPSATPTSAAAGALGALDDLDRQIQDLLATAGSGTPSEPEAPRAGAREVPESSPAGATGDIGALDADLARLTESLLTTNAPLPEAELAPQQRPATRHAAGPESTPTSDAAGAPKDERAEGAPPAGSASTPGVPASDAGSALPVRPAHVGLSSVGPGVARLGSSIGRAAGPAVLSVMAAASAPLAGRPKVVRDTVGWIAIWTAFLSLSLWTYLLFFHRPEVPRSNSAPIDIVGSDRGGAGRASGDAAPEGGAAPADTKERTGSAGH